MDFEKDVGDYVIVHELLHFFVPNHGKLWKSLMCAHLGDYEKMAEKLKIAQTSSQFLTDKGTISPKPCR